MNLVDCDDAVAALPVLAVDGVREVKGPEDLAELGKVFLEARLVDEQVRVVEVDHSVAQYHLQKMKSTILLYITLK